MEAWVIKRDDGRYLFTYWLYEDKNYGFGELNKARLFDSIESTQEDLRALRNYCRCTCKAVKIKICEVEENE